MAGNETTTRLNAPTVVGGDLMHETLLSDGSKAPRVVIIDDEGNLAPALTDAELRASAVPVRPATVTSARSTVAASVTDTLLLAANPDRVEVLIYNHSNSALYVGLGADPVSLSSFTHVVPAAVLWGPPIGFAGQIRGRWVTADGSAHVTELA